MQQNPLEEDNNLNTKTKTEYIENIEPFTRDEFDKVIKNLKNGKAVGSDSISNEMVKNSPKVMLDILYNFINTCFNKALVPKSWCLDFINPIHKE